MPAAPRMPTVPRMPADRPHVLVDLMTAELKVVGCNEKWRETCGEIESLGSWLPADCVAGLSGWLQPHANAKILGQPAPRELETFRLTFTDTHGMQRKVKIRATFHQQEDEDDESFLVDLSLASRRVHRVIEPMPTISESETP